MLERAQVVAWSVLSVALENIRDLLHKWAICSTAWLFILQAFDRPNAIGFSLLIGVMCGIGIVEIERWARRMLAVACAALLELAEEERLEGKR